MAIKFDLFYEDMEKKLKKAPTFAKKQTVAGVKVLRKTKKEPLKTRVNSKFKQIRDDFKKSVKSLRKPRKKAKKSTIEERKLARKARNRAILGIGLLLMVVSIIYSTAVVYFGVDSRESKIALFPQAFGALVAIIIAFSKILK